MLCKSAELLQIYFYVFQFLQLFYQLIEKKKIKFADFVSTVQCQPAQSHNAWLNGGMCLKRLNEGRVENRRRVF